MNNDSKITSGANQSFWTDKQLMPIKFSKLDQGQACDVVIVGGGIAGLSIAYRLIENNYKVIVIEDGYIGSGESGRTTAHLTYVLDKRYYDLNKLLGTKNAKLIAESHIEAINEIEAIIRKENIECDFSRVDGILFNHPSDTIETLEKEFEVAELLGLPVHWELSVTGQKENYQPCLSFENQAQFNPMKYLKGICDAIIRKGGKIFTETHAKEINSEGIKTDFGFNVIAKNVVIATNSPINNKYVMHLKQYPYRAYVIAALIPKNSIPFKIWWDTGDLDKSKEMPPYHFVRIQTYNETHDVLICGGEDHPTGQTKTDGTPEPDRYKILIEWCREHFEIGEIINEWSGQILYSMDGLAYLGRNPLDSDNIFITTGDSGNGMTYANIAAELITDLISGRENKYEKIYSPSRFEIFKAGKVFFKEVVGGFILYLKSKSEISELASTSELKTNEGSVFEIEGDKFGIYKNEENKLYIVNAKCTHRGCILNWNNDEKSWDCPCHGSRFNYFGEVINGPANEPLEFFKIDGKNHDLLP